MQVSPGCIAEDSLTPQLWLARAVLTTWLSGLVSYMKYIRHSIIIGYRVLDSFMLSSFTTFVLQAAYGCLHPNEEKFRRASPAWSILSLSFLTPRGTRQTSKELECWTAIGQYQEILSDCAYKDPVSHGESRFRLHAVKCITPRRACT